MGNTSFEGGELLHKLHIKGKITLLTGLHIGGSEVDLDIGGLDNEVVKVNDNGVMTPYIPGSSLKGKIRTLLGRFENKSDTKYDTIDVKKLFGESGDKSNPKDYPFVRGRAIFRDCYLWNDKDKTQNKSENVLENESENVSENVSENESEKILENKSENVIDRIKGSATPRQMERVIKGTTFELDIMIDVYKNDRTESGKSDNDEKLDESSKLLNTLKLGFKLLEYDYLGGSGSRGYGQIRFDSLKIAKIEFNKETGIAEIVSFNKEKKEKEKGYYQDFKL